VFAVLIKRICQAALATYVLLGSSSRRARADADWPSVRDLLYARRVNLPPLMELIWNYASTFGQRPAGFTRRCRPANVDVISVEDCMRRRYRTWPSLGRSVAHPPRVTPRPPVAAPARALATLVEKLDGTRTFAYGFYRRTQDFTMQVGSRGGGAGLRSLGDEIPQWGQGAKPR